MTLLCKCGAIVLQKRGKKRRENAKKIGKHEAWYGARAVSRFSGSFLLVVTAQDAKTKGLVWLWHCRVPFFQDHLREDSGYLKLLEACVWALIDVFPNSQAKNVVETVSRDREHQLGL
nr:hypothetical protein [Tanacetum cinerariifolium]